MAIQHAPDDRTIYLALNNIFTGSIAAIRRPAPIKKVFQQYQKRTEVAQLLRGYDLPTVVERVQWLLAERVFESTEYAKAKFPDLFQVSAAQSADRAASEAAAAARQAQTLEAAVEQEEEDGSADSGIENDYLDWDPRASKQHQQPQPQQPEGLDLSGNVGSSSPAAIRCTAAGVAVPSLFPMYLPFATGHRILAKTQSILEAACFRFAAETIPDVLARRGWDCAEAVELNVVLRQLLKHRSSLDRLEADTTSTDTTTTTATTPAAAAAAAAAAAPAAAAAGEQDLGRLSRSITQLRHTAVHRGRVTARVLTQFIADAESLAGRLGADRGAMSWLAGTRRRVEWHVAELEDSKSMLEAKLRRALGDIAARRAGLDRLEGAVVADVLREDGEYVASIGASLEEGEGPTVGREGEEDEADLGGEDPCGVAEGGCSAAGGDDADIYSLTDECDTEDDEDCFEDALEYESSLSEWFPGC